MPAIGLFTVYGPGGRFREFLVGSVIVFIHLRDLKIVIGKAAAVVQNLEKLALTMQKVLKMEAHLESQLQLIRNAKQAVLRDWLK